MNITIASILLPFKIFLALESFPHYFEFENFFGGSWDYGQHIGASKPW
jgi:hypothetical protein